MGHQIYSETLFYWGEIGNVLHQWFSNLGENNNPLVSFLNADSLTKCEGPDSEGLHIGSENLHFKSTSRYFPWLVWLSGLSGGLRTKGSLIWFPVRAHAWVAGQVPDGGLARSNHTLMFLSLPSPL